MTDTNINMLQTVANGLEELKEDMVFIGGAVAQLYADDPAATDIRATLDIDCVVEASTRIEYNKLERSLESKGFAHDTTPKAPICKWIYKDIKVDVMPMEESILGFSNKWYNEGIENKVQIALPDKTDIYIFSPEYYLASKFEAHNGRGGKDLRQSHDFEDIIYLFDNCTNILEVVKKASGKVKEYLKEQCRALLDYDNLIEGVECALPLRSDSDRTEMIIDMIQSIAGLD